AAGEPDPEGPRGRILRVLAGRRAAGLGDHGARQAKLALVGQPLPEPPGTLGARRLGEHSAAEALEDLVTRRGVLQALLRLAAVIDAGANQHETAGQRPRLVAPAALEEDGDFQGRRARETR